MQNAMNLNRCLVGKEWKVAQREIDWEIESHFGYTFLGERHTRSFFGKSTSLFTHAFS
jgi:hypothetical protein